MIISLFVELQVAADRPADWRTIQTICQAASGTRPLYMKRSLSFLSRSSPDRIWPANNLCLISELIGAPTRQLFVCGNHWAASRPAKQEQSFAKSFHLSIVQMSDPIRALKGEQWTCFGGPKRKRFYLICSAGQLNSMRVLIGTAKPLQARPAAGQPVDSRRQLTNRHLQLPISRINQLSRPSGAHNSPARLFANQTHSLTLSTALHFASKFAIRAIRRLQIPEAPALLREIRLAAMDELPLSALFMANSYANFSSKARPFTLIHSFIIPVTCTMACNQLTGRKKRTAATKLMTMTSPIVAACAWWVWLIMIVF